MSVISVRKLFASSMGTTRDRHSLAQLHRDIYPILFRYVAVRVGDPDAAECLTHELFLRLLDEPDSHPEDPQFPARLLISLATKSMQAYQRSSNHPVKRSISETKIQEALAALPEKQQLLLTLHFGCHLPVEGVAVALKLSPAAVRHLRAQAIMALHVQMGCP